LEASDFDFIRYYSVLGFFRCTCPKNRVVYVFWSRHISVFSSFQDWFGKEEMEVSGEVTFSQVFR